MKRNTLLLIAVITAVFVNATPVSDSILNSEVQILKKQFNDVLQKNDSLGIELEKINSKQLILKYNENYYQTALSTQTTIFSLITGGFFVFFGLATYISINLRINAIEKKTLEQLNEQNTEFNNFKQEVKVIEGQLSTVESNGNTVIAQMFRTSSQHTAAALYYLKSVTAHLKNEHFTAPTTLKNLDNALDSINAKTTEKHLTKNLEDIKKEIENINSNKSIGKLNEKHNLVLSKLRIKLDELTTPVK